MTPDERKAFIFTSVIAFVFLLIYCLGKLIGP